jgi:hypothetical protein
MPCAVMYQGKHTLHLILTLPATLHAFPPGKEGDKATGAGAVKRREMHGGARS